MQNQLSTGFDLLKNRSSKILIWMVWMRF